MPCYAYASLLRVIVLLSVISSVRPADEGGKQSGTEVTRQTDADWIDNRWSKTDVGPFLRQTIALPRAVVAQGIAIKVGKNSEGTVCFDPDLLRYAAGWTGGFLKLRPERYGLINPPAADGEIQFSTGNRPGWAMDGKFEDPRAMLAGPLPKDWGHYRGLYLSGDRVVLSYSVGKLEVLDSPWLEVANGVTVFTRTLQLKGAGEAVMQICDEPGAAITISGGGKSLLMKGKEGRLLVSISDAPGCALISGGEGSVRLRVVSTGECRVKISVAVDAGTEVTEFEKGVEAEALNSLLKGGARNWADSVETRGIIGKSDGPIAIDTLTLPYANPWNALMFASGHDFFENGDAAVCMAHGDVWRVSGIDEKLEILKWKRFATGLYEPLGLKIVGGEIYVIERDQITRLHDLNDDGEADYYENFNNDCISTGARHAFTTCLETDSADNFYFLKCADKTPQGGSLVKVSKDGRKAEVVASGFRNPNGMAISSSDLITVADQQGEWVPETRLDVIRPGGFYGYMPMHKGASAPTSFEPPLCWIPRGLDNSAGGQAWIPSGSWGAMGGKMLHLSYGRCTMMLILQDENLIGNGGIVQLPGRFLSGAMRGRFNRRDGALYISGLRGWQTAAVKDGSFQRVRYSGAPMLAPIAFAVEKDGVRLTFDQPLDRELAEDAASYNLEQWNYRWTAHYGSDDYSVRNPSQKGRDTVVLRSARLESPSTIRLTFADSVRPVNVLRISYSLESKGGAEIRGDFYCTINNVSTYGAH